MSGQLYPESEGPTACWALVLQSSKSKTNQAGNRFYMGAMRHRNPVLCTMGALAQYLFWRWHMSGEPAPNFRRRQDWYRLKVLAGEDPRVELSYGAQHEWCLAALQNAHITSDSVTHVMRGSGARHAELLGVSEAQVGAFICSLFYSTANQPLFCRSNERVNGITPH